MIETVPPLAQLASEIDKCRMCRLCGPGKRSVPGSGRVGADIMVVGQTPGYVEMKEGIAMVGLPGQFLISAMQNVGISPHRVYYTYLVKGDPGKKGTKALEPSDHSINQCKMWLEAEIVTVRPKLIVALGAIVMQEFGIKGGINQNSGKIFQTDLGPVLVLRSPNSIMAKPTDAPAFCTQLKAINTFLAGGTVETPLASKFEPQEGETVSLDIEAEHDKIWCVALTTKDGVVSRKWDEGGKELVEIMQERGAIPLCHNARYDLWKLKEVGITFPDFHDTIISAHLLGLQPLGLKKLAPILLGRNMEEFAEVVGLGKKAKPMDSIKENVLKYCGVDSGNTAQIHALLDAEIDRRNLRWVYNQEKEISNILVDMKMRGLPISQVRLADAKRRLIEEMGRLEAELQVDGINPVNRDEVAARFWKGKANPRLTAKDERLSTTAKDMRDCATPAQKEWVERFILWHRYDKFNSTYVRAWEGKDWIHSDLNQTGTATWRFSSSKPNLQNVPLQDTKAIPLYQLFVAPPGYSFISADANQGEMRILGNVSNDEALKKVYRDGRDLHQETQDVIEKLGTFAKYHIEGNTDKRKAAKVANFRIPYGTCLTLGHRVLKADLTWVPVEYLSVGDRLVGFDENSPGKGKHRRWKVSTVLGTGRGEEEVHHIVLSDGTQLTATGQHKWIVRRRQQTWVRTDKLIPGDILPRYVQPWVAARTYDAGWLSGFFDGEGSLTKTTYTLGAKQKLGPTLSKAVGISRSLGFKCGVYQYGDMAANMVIRGGTAERLRFLGVVRPTRLLLGLDINRLGRMEAIPNDQPTVISIESGGFQEIIRLTTSEETYIAEGFGSHNTAKGIADELGVDIKVGEGIIGGFYAAYPRIRPWQDEQTAFAELTGYVKTFDGVPLYIPCLLAEKGWLHSHGANQAGNYPIQGGLARIIKDAMRRCPQFLNFQVHDELLYLVPDAEVPAYKKFLEETLLDKRHEIPYTWSITVGRTWGDIKHLEDIWDKPTTEEENE